MRFVTQRKIRRFSPFETLFELSVRADCGLRLRMLANHAATLEADIQGTPKLGFALWCRKSASICGLLSVRSMAALRT